MSVAIVVYSLWYVATRCAYAWDRRRYGFDFGDLRLYLPFAPEAFAVGAIGLALPMISIFLLPELWGGLRRRYNRAVRRRLNGEPQWTAGTLYGQLPCFRIEFRHKTSSAVVSFVAVPVAEERWCVTRGMSSQTAREIAETGDFVAKGPSAAVVQRMAVDRAEEVEGLEWLPTGPDKPDLRIDLVE